MGVFSLEILLKLGYLLGLLIRYLDGIEQRIPKPDKVFLYGIFFYHALFFLPGTGITVRADIFDTVTFVVVWVLLGELWVGPFFRRKSEDEGELGGAGGIEYE